MSKISRRGFIQISFITLTFSAIASFLARRLRSRSVVRCDSDLIVSVENPSSTTDAHFTLAETGKKRPNLLIIQTDEHNFRTLGCYRTTLPPEQAFMWGRNAVVETPNIDWIAGNGAICTKFYATSPVCSPSRASFVSGQYPQNTWFFRHHGENCIIGHL